LLKLMDEDKLLTEKIYKCNLSINNIKKQIDKNANEKNFYIEQLNKLEKEYNVKDKLNNNLQESYNNLNNNKKLIEDRLQNLKKEYGHSLEKFNKYEKKLNDYKHRITLLRDLISQLIIDKIDNLKDFKQQFPFRKIIDIEGILNDNELIYYGDILVFQDSARDNLIDYLKEKNLSINFIFEGELEAFVEQLEQNRVKHIDGNVYYNGFYFRSIGKDDKMEKLLVYKKELALLEEKIVDTKKKYREVEREKESLKVDKIKAQNEYDQLNLNLRKVEQEIGNNRQIVESMSKQIKQYNFKLDLLNREDKNLNIELNEISEDIRLKEDRKKDVLEEIKTRKKGANKIRHNLENLEKQLSSVKDLYMKIVIERKELSKKLEYLEKEFDNYNKIYKKNKNEIKNIYITIDNINLNINENNDKLIQYNSALNSNISICNKLKECRAGLLEELKNNKEYMQKMEGKLRKWQERIDNFNKKYAKFDVEEAKLNTQIENLSLQYNQQFNGSIQDEIINIEDNDKTLLTNKLFKIESKLKEIGPINMAANDEYEKSQERYEFLKTQYDDINNSVKKINEMIKEFDKESITRFNTAFNSIRENFQRVIDILFSGGKGDIKLTEPVNVLDAGIEIYVQPKGKRLRNLNLLSGGEKALTSLALLFSFFLYRKAPFCFLDEIDAPLDDLNIGKFIDIVKELSKDTQFIIITHNYKTMEFANNIYGVTNSEPGVSVVYSLKNSNLFNNALTDNIDNKDKAWGY
ncbi:MAG: hypothetical protein SVN78_08395, partial [Deferribacterota bacterium]|nr:hypothetical protein [Deferribacterota bacterium]